MRPKTLIARFIVLIALGSLTWLIITAPVPAQGFGLSPGILRAGGFSTGIGFYQAPNNDAISDSGMYSFARYELSNFGLELDYGFSDLNFFLGTVDYLYPVSMAGGVTQTEVALGGGLTIVNNDPSFDESKFGTNVMSQISFMDKLAVRLRYDFLEGDADLWTFGLSYAF
jgi:hypothetical protein